MLLCDTDYDMECQINLVGGKMIPFELQVDLEKFLEKETEDTASTIPYLEVWERQDLEDAYIKILTYFEKRGIAIEVTPIIDFRTPRMEAEHRVIDQMRIYGYSFQEACRICMDECQKNCDQDELNEIVELFERQIYKVVQAQLAEDIVNTR